MTTIFFPYNAGGSNGPDREQQRQNRQSARKSEDNDRRIAQLEEQVARLSLLSEALWQLLAEHGDFKQADLIKAVEQVSQQSDARKTQKLRCTKCSMAVPANLKACMYCGEALSGEHTQSPFP